MTTAATATAPHPIIDEVTAHTRQRCTLARTYRIRSEAVQVRIARDVSLNQSFAVAKVLTPDRRWTTLATQPAALWHPSTSGDPGLDIDAVLAPVADQLAQRAATILAPSTAPDHQHPTRDTTLHGERIIGANNGRLILSYHDPDAYLTVQVIRTADGHDLRWADGISEFGESYPALSTALARFAVLTAKIEQGGEPVLPRTFRQFADAARTFHRTALTESPSDTPHGYATIHLADGRIVDVFESGNVQVHTPDLAHAYEFSLPAVTPDAGNPPVSFLPLG